MTPCVGVGPGFFGVDARPVIFASSLVSSPCGVVGVVVRREEGTGLWEKL
jgi:hypothetical protein